MEDSPVKTQDRLKAIWDLHGRTGEKAALDDVTERMGEKKPTAGEAVKRLAVRDLISHESYRGISLSDRGRNVALVMARCHRLTESFLVFALGCTQDEIHEETEKPEHTVSGEFINHIDAMLGFLERDPYGDSIPSISGAIASAAHTNLADIEAGAIVVVGRINDFDPELLRYSAASGVGPGTVFRARATSYAGMRVFAILDEVGGIEPKKIYMAGSVLWTIKATPTTS